MNWLIQALNGFSFGALLYLLSSGFTITFGLARVANMAHGGFYLLGGYFGFSVLRWTGNYWLGMLASGLGIVIFNFFFEKYLIRRTMDNVLAQVLLTVGVTYVIADVALMIWGSDPLQISPPAFARGPIVLPFEIYYPRYRFLLILFGVIVGVLQWVFYKKTQFGAVIRAGVDDREMVGALGINVDRLFALVFALAAFLAGISGMMGGAFLTLYPGAEWEILVLALVVVIVGGLGSLEGAMLGSIIVGMVDAYGRWLLPDFSYFMVFAPMAILLLIRPTGLFGKEH